MACSTRSFSPELRSTRGHRSYQAFVHKMCGRVGGWLGCPEQATTAAHGNPEFTRRRPDTCTASHARNGSCRITRQSARPLESCAVCPNVKIGWREQRHAQMCAGALRLPHCMYLALERILLAILRRDALIPALGRHGGHGRPFGQRPVGVELSPEVDRLGLQSSAHFSLNVHSVGRGTQFESHRCCAPSSPRARR